MDAFRHMRIILSDKYPIGGQVLPNSIQLVFRLPGLSEDSTYIWRMLISNHPWLVVYPIHGEFLIGEWKRLSDCPSGVYKRRLYSLSGFIRTAVHLWKYQVIHLGISTFKGSPCRTSTIFETTDTLPQTDQRTWTVNQFLIWTWDPRQTSPSLTFLLPEVLGMAGPTKTKQQPHATAEQSN